MPLASNATSPPPFLEIMTDNKNNLIFHNENGDIKLSVDFESETIWATQKQIAELFGVNLAAISKHITNIFDEGELERNTVISKMEIATDDGKKNQVEHYNLDMVISVGYRVNSTKATEFRKWATKQLKELITDGFVIDDNRFAKGQLASFQKLIDRVRSIRTSERNFYSKILDIFATSSDYNSSSKTATDFFATIQNKFHYAIHGNTAADLVNKRIDSDKINMGMTSRKDKKDITMVEAKTAKNYLSELEIKKLELLSEQFLSFAELRYYDKKNMTMKDWEIKLDEFLTFNDKEILKNKGKISSMALNTLVDSELKKYKQKILP